MVTASFIVEGDSEVQFVRSDYFRKWLIERCGISLIGDPKEGNCKGKDLCTRHFYRGLFASLILPLS